LGKLRIYTDENVDVRIAEGLCRRKIDAFSAREKGALGFNDKQHFEKAKELEAVIFTHDPHLIEIAENLVKSGKEHCGLIFAEMHKFSVGECIRRLALYVELVSSKEMINRIEFL
jgi:predicted nuclease of predicted toxin-antitoxin system